jgi:hypothetical protein
VKEILSKRLPNGLREGLGADRRPVQVIIKESDNDAVTIAIRKAVKALDEFAAQFFNEKEAEKDRQFSAWQLTKKLTDMDKVGELGQGKLAALMAVRAREV